MSKMRKRAVSFPETLPDYVREGLVLYLDGSEPLMKVSDTRVWNDSNLRGQYAELESVYTGNSVITFDGVSSCGRIKEAQSVASCEILSGLKERTIEVVCKLNDTQNVQSIFLGKGNAVYSSFAAGLWYRPSSNGFKCATCNEQNASLVSNVDQLASYSVVYGGDDINNYSLYQNGVYCQKGATGGNIANPTYPVIGARYNNAAYSYRLQGEIACIRVYDRMLTDTERERNLATDKKRFGI